MTRVCISVRNMNANDIVNLETTCAVGRNLIAAYEPALRHATVLCIHCIWRLYTVSLYKHFKQHHMPLSYFTMLYPPNC